MNLHYRTIPHGQQRYPTVGDYWFEKDGWEFRVSDMGNEDYEFLVLIHELVEQRLAAKHNIPEPSIAAYDKVYEASRDERSLAEPGDNKDAPYYAEHQAATGIERIVAVLLGVDWNDYNNTVENLQRKGVEDGIR